MKGGGDRLGGDGESAGIGQALAGEDFGQNSVIGGEVDPACLSSHRKASTAGAYTRIDDGDDD